jgi:hypothetical protein
MRYNTVPFLAIAIFLFSRARRIHAWVLLPRECSFSSRVVLSSSLDDSNLDDSNFDGSDTDKNNDSDNDMKIDNPLDLQRVLRSSDNTFKQKDLYQSRRNNQNPIDDDLLSNINAIARQQVPSADSMNVDYESDDDDDADDDDDDGSVFLDGDAYMQASSSLNPDGSLPAYMFGEGKAPGDENPYGDNQEEDGLSIQDLIRSVNEKQQQPPDLDQAKAMRDQIFEAEEAFTTQSSEFLDALGGNVTAGKEATSIRRNKQYEKEQSEHFGKLEEALDDWQDVLQQNQTEKNRQRQESKTSVPPPPKEEQEEPTKKESGEWIAVDDPSTGEQFYWNTETGEMQMEVDGESVQWLPMD